ncbi:MAG: imidazolonepropionase [Alphaproteobacteria bacterium]|nr:imidazolonepropionase [Alphaproteobacteria bacterium]
MATRLLIHGTVATMTEGGAAYGLIEDGAVLLEGGRIAWAGTTSDAPFHDRPEDLGGRLVTPALIDCHTHIVFGGDRAREFEMRLLGASYAEIAKAGGGILSTVTATRVLDAETLARQALPRLDALIREGVSTVEVKSGYGLTIADEVKMLRAARRLADLRPVTIVTSWLAAHAIPPEYENAADRYIAEVAIPGLRQAHAEGLVDQVDGFCEGIAFSPTQIALVFEAAAALGLPVKLHAEQLSNLGGAKMAAGHGALSCDHVEYLDADGVRAMAAAGSVAVLLPGAFYTLHETQAPPVDAFRRAGVPMAVASDGNPGSSPMFSLLLALNMAATLFRLTPEEALAGATRNAARALGLSDRGTIQAEKRADLAIWDAAHPAELSYRIGYNPLAQRIHGGIDA